MAKSFTISFPVKSAEELAERLGVSKARRNHIYKVVGEIIKRSSSHGTIRTKARRVGKNTKSRQRNNAKTTR